MVNIFIARRCARALFEALLIFGVLIIFFSSSAFAKQRLRMFDITFPQPKKKQMARLADIRIRSRHISPRVFASTEITFYLDERGRVDSIGWSHAPADSSIFEPYRDSLLVTEFEAGKIHGKKSSFALVAKLIVLGERFGARGVVGLPVNARGELTDNSLALKSLANYNYRPAELVKFPPYFYRRPDNGAEEDRLYEFAVIHVSLDSLGSPGARSVLFATDKSVGEMLQIACGWADYSAAEMNGRKISAEGFVFVRFFHGIPYPVGQWQAACGDSTFAGLNQMRVSWIPGQRFGDVPAVQKGNQNLEVTIPLSFSKDLEKEGQLRVDANGRAFITNLSGLTGKIDQQLALDKLNSIPFYPAFRLTIDSSNQQTRLDYLSSLGRLKLMPLDSRTYRLQTEFIDNYNTPERTKSGRH